MYGPAHEELEEGFLSKLASFCNVWMYPTLSEVILTSYGMFLKN
jgi:hypothetical protein